MFKTLQTIKNENYEAAAAKGQRGPVSNNKAILEACGPVRPSTPQPNTMAFCPHCNMGAMFIVTEDELFGCAPQVVPEETCGCEFSNEDRLQMEAYALNFFYELGERFSDKEVERVIAEQRTERLRKVS